MRQALHARWRQELRFIVHIANSPLLKPDGSTFLVSDSESHEGQYKQLLNSMMDLNINYVSLTASIFPNNMTALFFKEYAQRSDNCSLARRNIFYHESPTFLSARQNESHIKPRQGKDLWFREFDISDAQELRDFFIHRAVVATPASAMQIWASHPDPSRILQYDEENTKAVWTWGLVA